MEHAHGTATLLLLNVPTSALCGLDLVSFQTSSRFRGVKLIPEGWHFVFLGIDAAFSIRRGAWFRVLPVKSNKLPPELLIRRYDPELEELVVDQDPETVGKWKSDLASIWRDGLTPYRTSVSQDPSQTEETFTEERRDWGRLTNCINDKLLSRITGQMHACNSWGLTSASCAKQDVDNIPGLDAKETKLYQEQNLGFLPIDLKQTWRSGAVGRERTEAAQDRTWALRNLVREYCNEAEDVIGELQFCFLMVLTLNNNSCLEQWKRILSLLLTCKLAAVEQAEFFVRFLETIKLQLEHSQDAEGGLFDLSDDGAPLLKSLLKRFRRGLEQQDEHAAADVTEALKNLEDFLKLEYGWVINEPHVRSGLLQLEDGEEVNMDMNDSDEEAESGDYAPTIVGLTADQARLLQLDGYSVPGYEPGQSALERDVASSLEHEEQAGEDSENGATR